MVQYWCRTSSCETNVVEYVEFRVPARVKLLNDLNAHVIRVYSHWK